MSSYTLNVRLERFGARTVISKASKVADIELFYLTLLAQKGFSPKNTTERSKKTINPVKLVIQFTKNQVSTKHTHNRDAMKWLSPEMFFSPDKKKGEKMFV